MSIDRLFYSDKCQTMTLHNFTLTCSHYPHYIGEAHGRITAETQKYFNNISYNTSLNGQIYPSYAQQTLKP